MNKNKQRLAVKRVKLLAAKAEIEIIKLQALSCHPLFSITSLAAAAQKHAAILHTNHKILATSGRIDKRRQRRFEPWVKKSKTVKVNKNEQS